MKTLLLTGLGAVALKVPESWGVLMRNRNNLMRSYMAIQERICRPLPMCPPSPREKGVLS